MIPNDTIISSNIENQTVRKYRRADFSLGLIYDTTLAQMEK
jgi:small-conductance mechanosensitive channel